MCSSTRMSRRIHCMINISWKTLMFATGCGTDPGDKKNNTPPTWDTAQNYTGR